MCTKDTPIGEQVLCSRCGKVANPTDSWEHDWPLYGFIDIGYPGSLLHYLNGPKLTQGKDDVSFWQHHPAFIKADFQEIKIKWGNGFRYENEYYRLCMTCQRELITMLGSYFEKEIRNVNTKEEKVEHKALTIEDMEFLTPEARLAYYVDMNEALVKLLDSMWDRVPAKGTFEWAMMQAKKGKNIRFEGWGHGFYVKAFPAEDGEFFGFVDCNGCDYDMAGAPILDDGWEVVE